MKIIFATHNPGKLREMKEILADLPVELLGAEEVGIFEEPEESGKDFKENAFIKASFVAKTTGLWTIADDTGLSIDALGGKPGVRSARWAGKDFPKEKLADYTLDKMKDIPKGKRNCYFETAVCLIESEWDHWTFPGRVYGEITTEKRGDAQWFLPYDFIFQPEGFDKTFAEMGEEKKNSISHRGVALRKVKKFLEDQIKKKKGKI